MLDRLLNPRHLAFWTLLASVATVIGLVVTIMVSVAGNSGGQTQRPNVSGQSTAGGSPVAVSHPAATTDTSAPDTGGSGATGRIYLSTLKPVRTAYATVVAGPIQFGTTTYQQSIRFTCEGGQSSVVYNVAGFTFLDATLDVPNDATNAAGHTAAVTFLKDGTTAQLGQPITDVLGKPQPIHLDLQGSAQLDIACVATDAGGGYQSMDIALGNATLIPS